MINAGIYSLGDIAITQPAIYIGNWVSNLAGVSAISIDLEFLYGAGGTSGKIFLQTSARQATLTLDAGVDIAAVSFLTASKSVCLNLTGLYPIGAFVPTDSAMTVDTSLDGFLGDRFRLKVVTLGTYSGQTVVSGRISAR